MFNSFIFKRSCLNFDFLTSICNQNFYKMIKKKLNKLVFALIIAGILIICFKIHFSRKQLNNNLIVKSILSKKNQSISRINLLCFVLTSKKTIFQRGPAVWNTWSKRCDKSMFVLNRCS